MPGKFIAIFGDDCGGEDTGSRDEYVCPCLHAADQKRLSILYNDVEVKTPVF
jgi:hypothetical protein